MTTTTTSTVPAASEAAPAVNRRRRGGGASATGPRNRQGAGGPRTTSGTDVPVTGLIDVVDDKVWVRADGYLPGPGDINVTPGALRALGLRRGDHVVGTAHVQPHRPATLTVTSVNGRDPGDRRPEFYSLTALYPQERLNLGTGDLTARIVDLFMPIGKGQRALIVAPPKAGKTMILQSMANAIADNHPEAHLMVVLVDERPEEVTDMRRSVRGEVIAATFDQRPEEHTALAELAVERAKRLVEQGRDVVILLDSITRLGRAYNLAAPGRGRTLSGGLDSTALHPPKRILGAARNIEGGGSLTIIATALVETGSALDGVIFEEFKGTGNAELRLDRALAESRVFPAVNISGSSTRHEEALMCPAELAITHRLRRALSNQERRPALEQLMTQLKGTPANRDFLRQIAAALP
jgi:transcription termination factor Rho